MAAQKPASSIFFVEAQGLAILEADGTEKQAFDMSEMNGAMSPGARWVAAVKARDPRGRLKLIIRPLAGQEEPTLLELVFGEPGRSGTRLVWSDDGKRLFIGENACNAQGQRAYAYRIYDLATKQLKDVILPDGTDVTDWSIDGKRLLVTLSNETDSRVAWLNADGHSEPELLTEKEEIAYDARLSPDGRRILLLRRPVSPNGQVAETRLYVMDLATKKRTIVGEPGEVHGCCWSPDGTKVAYTWQETLAKPEKVRSRVTELIVCTPGWR
jgi:Tol biopolymer transport system component